MDADWNEQNDIQFHHEQTFLRDLIGKNGTLIENNGFKISLQSFDLSLIPSDIDVVNTLKSFLKDRFHLDWIANQPFTKTTDNTITITDGTLTATITPSGDKAILAVPGNINAYEFTMSKNKLHTHEYVIGAGNYYVDGILCENELPVLATMQPDLQTALSSLFKDHYYLAYLDVWERHITHLEDPYLLEQALDGVDTATRTKIVWQVKLLDIGTNYTKCNLWNSKLHDNINQPTTGKMQARAKPSPQNTAKCSLYETAGYVGLENQLYRVEVHNSGNLTNANFKWSRDNGTIVSKIKEFKSNENKIEIEERGKDRLIDFTKDQWVEITDESHEQLGTAGTLVKIKELNGTTLEYYPVTGDKITKKSFPLNPKIRRWESKGDSVLITVEDLHAYIELEDGVQINLSEGNYRTGDYWLIPARTKSGTVEWPTFGISEEPLALLPFGIMHHYAPLALLQYTDSKFEFKEDLRGFFSSLTDLVMIHYAGGNGQEALRDNSLPVPLRVAVTVGNVPISETPLGHAKVRFVIVPSTSGASLTALKNGHIEGSPDSSCVNVDTNGEGIAECTWKLGVGNIKQQVKAMLLDDCDNPILPPIYFNATLPLSFYYISGDGEQALPGNTIELKTGIMIGNTPATGSDYDVEFSLVHNTGNLVISTPALDGNGIAACKWTLGDSPSHQQVKAILKYQGNPTNLPPIYFNATLPLSFYYVEGDGMETKPGSSIEIAAGVKIGNTSTLSETILNDYKVKFSQVSNKGSGTLDGEPSATKSILSDGIVKCEWRLDDKTEFQQVKAELVYGDDDSPTNLAPIYFNARFLQNQNTSIATSGILNLGFTFDKKQPLLKFGPFEHFLENLEIPPAVFLGVPNPNEIDSVIMSMKNSIEIGKSVIEYETFNIDKNKFMVQITSTSGGLFPSYVPLTLRWWALPATERTQKGYGATIELDQKVYTWTDKVYITVVAPDYNLDSDLIDKIGDNPDSRIIIETSKGKLDLYKLVETGTDTGIFTGEVVLTGFKRQDASEYEKEFVLEKTEGSGPTNGQIASSNDDSITVSFLTKYGLIQTRAPIKWNVGTIEWLKAVYLSNGEGIVRVTDPDMNLNPNKLDEIKINVISETDTEGIELTLTETNEASGIFEGTVHFTPAERSSSQQLKVTEGDRLTATFVDDTLPEGGKRALAATAMIKGVRPRRVTMTNLRFVDELGNPVDIIRINQQVQVSADLANRKRTEQPFVVLIEIMRNGVLINSSWVNGVLAANTTLNPALSWTPQKIGAYEITLSVLENQESRIQLAPPLSTRVQVND